jgi:oligopeptide transport system substrate-binding protein
MEKPKMVRGNISKKFRKVSLAVALAAFATSPAQAATEKVLNFALQQEPPQLNAMKATDTQSFFVLGHVMEGLTTYGKKEGEYIPGVAESWKITDKEAIFKIRKNAKWSDGKPVTAQDFVFGWKTALDPKMASEYAFILYPIKNAEAIHRQDARHGNRRRGCRRAHAQSDL